MAIKPWSQLTLTEQVNKLKRYYSNLSPRTLFAYLILQEDKKNNPVRTLYARFIYNESIKTLHLIRIRP